MTTRATGRRRLARLATFLEETKFPRGKFHLASWMGGYKRVLAVLEGSNDAIPKDPATKGISKRLSKINADEPAFKVISNEGVYETVMPLDCKTVGCAIGWGIVGIPSFRKAGLCFTDAGDLSQGDCAQIMYREKDSIELSFQAVEKFFSLPIEASTRLFHGAFYAVKDRSNPKAVAKRIRLFLAEGEQALYCYARPSRD